MTHTDPALAPPGDAHAWETCDHCQAPLAADQRYCVVCGARRASADDPAARYFVEQARRLRAAQQAPAPQGVPPSSRLRFALVFALLPLVAALGIVVGRSNGGGGDLVDALKAQKAPVVNVIGGSGGTSASTGRAATHGSGAGSGAKRTTDAAKGDVIAKTKYGTARRLTDARVTPQQLDASKRALEHIVESKGRAYVDQQRNLPDQIVIP